MDAGIEIRINIGPGMTPGHVCHVLHWLAEYFMRHNDPFKYNVIALRDAQDGLVGAATVMPAKEEGP